MGKVGTKQTNENNPPTLSDVLFRQREKTIDLSPQISNFLCIVRDNKGCTSLNPQLSEKIQAVCKNSQNDITLTKDEARELSRALLNFSATTPNMIRADFPGSLCNVLDNLF